MVVVFRDETLFGPLGPFVLMVDGVYRALLRSPRFVCLPLSPGEHELSGQGLSPIQRCCVLPLTGCRRLRQTKANALSISVREGEVVLVRLRPVVLERVVHRADDPPPFR